MLANMLAEILQKHVALNCPPPQPENGGVPDQATAAEDSAHETEPQDNEAPESGAKGAGSSDEKSESSQTLSSPLSATSPKLKKRAREDDEEVSSASKQPGASPKSQSDAQSAGYDFFENVVEISK